ncbi:hypothetical protein, partial [Pleurochrysis sp. endemic virus 2]
MYSNTRMGCMLSATLQISRNVRCTISSELPPPPPPPPP